MKKSILHSSRGMTLMELLVVVVIIGLLAAISVPSYRAYTVRTHRAAARACLAEYAQYMERYYTSNMTYAGAEDTVLGCATEGGLDRHYELEILDFAQRTYTLGATPIGAQADKDAACGTLTMRENGLRAAGPDGNNSSADLLKKCW
jgi:type IV pilus assembly protein PilE